jgi:hypothetical protein
VAAPAFSQTAPQIGDRGSEAAFTMHVGDGTITGKRLTGYRIGWHGTLYPGGGEVVDGGVWIQQMRREKMNGRDVLIRTAGAVLFQRNTFKYLGAAANESVVDAHTLAPISSEAHNPDGSGERWTFDGKHVEWLQWSGDPRKETLRRFDLPIPAYDIASTMLPVLLSVQPLKLGYSGVIPVVGDPEHPLRSVPFRVVRKEKVRAGARGVVDAWLVECPDPNTGTLRFWISDKLPYPIKMIVPAAPGIPRTVYSMIG